MLFGQCPNRGGTNLKGASLNPQTVKYCSPSQLSFDPDQDDSEAPEERRSLTAGRYKVRFNRVAIQSKYDCSSCQTGCAYIRIENNFHRAREGAAKDSTGDFRATAASAAWRTLRSTRPRTLVKMTFQKVESPQQTASRKDNRQPTAATLKLSFQGSTW